MDPSILDDFLDSKLWVITGKGGVGKSSVAAMMAKLAVAQGKKVLLVETHACTSLGRILGQKKFGYKEHSISKNLHIIQINPQDAFEEFILDQVKFKSVYNTIFNNRYVKNFMEATPGLNELLTIGKVWSLCEEHEKFAEGSYDLVILDAPATGHALALLKVSQVVENAVRVGPLKTKSEKISNLILDHKKTQVFIVTLAEDMPINECIELKDKLDEEKISVAGIIVNQVWPEIFPTKAAQQVRKKNLALIQDYFCRYDQSVEQIHRIHEAFPDLNRFEIPLIWNYNHKTELPDLMKEHLQPIRKLNS